MAPPPPSSSTGSSRLNGAAHRAAAGHHKAAGEAPKAPLMLSVSGCRGVLGESMTPETALRFAYAFGGYLVERAADAKAGSKAGSKGGKKTGSTKIARPAVVLAADGRWGGGMIAGAAQAGLNAAGCDVVNVEVVPTPSAGFLVDAWNYAGGLVITASHNPQNWLGLKPVLRSPKAKLGSIDAGAPDKQTAAEIIERFHATASVPCGSWESLGRVTYANGVGDAHGQQLLEVLDGLGVRRLIAKSKFKVVVDHLGMSGAVADGALLDALCGPKGKAWFEVDTAEDTDGIFPHTPEPLRENLLGLGKAVKARRADVGFAQDPDADRLAIIDEKGRYIGEECTLVLCAIALAQLGLISKKSTLVCNLSTSRMIEDVAATLGAKVLRSAVGEANVVEVMKKVGSPFGGEGNGGVIWPVATYVRDSLAGMALVLALLAMEKRPLSAIVADIPVYAIEKRKVELRDKEVAKAAVEKIASEFSDYEIDRQDGVRVDFAEQRAWLHVRASNTEPIMRLIAEAPSIKEAEAILAEAGRIIG